MSKLKEKTGIYAYNEQKVQYMSIADNDDTSSNTSSSKWYNNINMKDDSSSNKMIKRVLWIATFTLSLSLLVLITLLCTGVNEYQSSEPIISINYDHVTQTYEAIQSTSAASATTASSQYMRKKDGSDKVLATGTYIKNYNSNGWNHITVQASKLTAPSKSPTKAPISHHSDTTDIDTYIAQMEAIGMIEGYATCHEMNDFYVNYYSGLFDGGDPMPATITFLVDNHEWMQKQADKYYKTDDYWLVVKGILAQLKGLVSGLQHGCPGTSGINTDDEDLHTIPNLRNLLKRPSLAHMLLLNANGDLYQIAEKYHQKDSAPSKDDDNDTPTETAPTDGDIPMSLTKRLGRSGKGPSLGGGFRETGVDHCSVLIKLLDDRSDTVFAHNTWDDFQCAAPRIIKHYTYPLMKAGKNVGTYDLHFSSSPGFLSSVDDFFVVSGHSKFFVTETTFDLYNEDLLQMVQPESMLSWVRARLASELASSGAEWADVFTQYHSGTYDNEWMVLDFSRFRQGMDPVDGFLYVIEEVPGYVHREDMTQKLIADGYWASYNNPYFTDIREISGNEALCRQDPNYCHDSDPRAKIFREHQHEVIDIDTMKTMIAYNHWQTDPLSNNDSCSAIACRQDLEPVESNRYPFGATDAKVSSVMKASQPIPDIHTRLGPTHDDQTPFCWNVFDEKYRNLRGKHFSHEGHPPCFDFNWEIMPPR